MESPARKISSTATKVLFIPKLPPSLSDWNTLKNHFSKYGDVTNAVVNPQEKWCTVSFKTVSDAKVAKSIGCVWKNKTFDSHFWNGSKSSPSDNSRAVGADIFSYSDLDALWTNEDNENFGVIKSILVSDEKPKEKKLLSLSGERKSKSDGLVKTTKSKVKPYSEKINKSKSLTKETLVKEKPKDVKRKVKSIALGIERKKHMLTVKKKEDGVLKEELSAPGRGQSYPKLSLKEKFAILEERDKLIRKSFVKSSSVKCKAVVGTCPDMCPEKERIMREYRRLVAVYEMIPNTQSMDHSLAVKAYVRSSADQEEPLPHELRPEPVLSMTMSYLINEIMPLIENSDVNVSEWYDFCWDRLRSIRKDIIQQQLCDLETVTIIEQCARFHICCYDRFWGIDPLIFDEKINTENLMNCLQSLRHMYEDLSKENIKCPNEAEFKSYMILLNMRTGDVMAAYQKFSENLLKEERIQSAVKIYSTLNNLMYSQFFKLVKKSTYLDACLLQRYFYHVRVQALQAIARAYCPPNKSGSIPLKQMVKILKFDSLEDTKLFCEGHGLLLKENKKDFRLHRNDFFFPEIKIIFQNSSSLVTKKRVDLVKAVVGDGYYFRDYKNHRVHSSFAKDGKLNELASNASDQKSKSKFELLIGPSGKKMEVMQVETEEINVEDIEMIGDKDPCIEESDYKFGEMDVDSEILTDYPQQSLSPMRSLYDEKSSQSSFTKDAVSGEQRVSSTFIFSLKATSEVKEKEESHSEIAGPFKFSLGTSIFDNKNMLSPLICQSNSNMNNTVPMEKSNVGHVETFSKRICAETLSDLKSDKSHVSFSNAPKEEKDSSVVRPLKRVQSFDNNEELLKTKRPGLSSVDFPKSTVTADNVFVDLKQKEDQNQSYSTIKNESEIKITNAELRVHDFAFPSQKQRLPSSPGGCNKESKIKPSVNDINDQSDMNSNKQVIIKSEFSSVDAERVSQSNKENMKKKVKVESDVSNKKEEENKKKLRLERDRVLQMLRKDLRKRLKVVTARHFIRKWKQKVDKIQNSRKEFPLLLPVSPDDHISVWGTTLKFSSMSNCSLLKRLKEKQHNIKIVTAILNDGIQNTVIYVGDKIAEKIASKSCFKLNLRDFNIPICWKLVVSIPSLKGSEFFVNKIKHFITKIFYKAEGSSVGSVVKEITSQNIPVHYCVHLLSGSEFHCDTDKITGMSGLIFFSISGTESSAEKCKRLHQIFVASNKNMNRVPVAFMKIGMENDPQLERCVNEKIQKKVIQHCIEEYWSDFQSIDNALKFLTDNFNVSSNIQVHSLDSLFRYISEHLYDVLTTAKTISDSFQNALTDPNIIIKFYNSFFATLEDMILDSDYKETDVVPPEFKEYVESFRKPGELEHFGVSFNKSHSANIVKAFSKINLPNIKSWPPHDAYDMLNIFDSYCNSINCSKILPRIIRIIDFKSVDDDDVDFLKYINTKVSWVNIVELIVNSILLLYCIGNKKVIVIYDSDELNDLCRIDFSFKLLQCITNET